MAIFNSGKKYKWEFVNVGGSYRVEISTGEDIAHLSELDPTMWTVLSCPTSGLEIDDKSLEYIDWDKDGKIRVTDVVTVSKWITDLLKDKDILLKGVDTVDINQINTEAADGQKLYNTAKQILGNLGKDTDTICLSDTVDISAIFAKTRFNGDGVITENTAEDDVVLRNTIKFIMNTMGTIQDRSGEEGISVAKIEDFYSNLALYTEWKNNAVEAPFGDATELIIDSYNALDTKVRDFFMRSKLAVFSPDSVALLDIKKENIAAISDNNLVLHSDEIANYPLSHITGQAELNVNAPINPVWVDKFNVIKQYCLESGQEVITEKDWESIGKRFESYTAWKASKKGEAVESLGDETIKNILSEDNKLALLELVEKDISVKDESENIEMVSKFLHILRDFYRLVRNFVTLHDFYDKDKDVKAIFQCGTLIIDQRACHFCMKVNDTAQHSSLATHSGMFLLYCDCYSRSQKEKIEIVATVTVGDIAQLSVGKNGIFYDNAGGEWDAVITKIVDNPINISQSFWSPYRRMATAIENLINKNASDKDAKVMEKFTTGLSTVSKNTSAENKAAAPAAPPFDIAKFAGIFAALGMALGMISTALTSFFKGLFVLKWWQVIMLFMGIMLAISGPSMIMAWLKLRRRNIAPLLNANGWAVNAVSKISIPFGETLTDIANYPKIKLKDPYAKKGWPAWKRWLFSVLTVLVVVLGLWLFNILSVISPSLKSPIKWFHKENIVEVMSNVSESIEETLKIEMDSTAVVIDSTAN